MNPILAFFSFTQTPLLPSQSISARTKKARRSSFLNRLFAVLAAGMSLLVGAAVGEVENPKEVAGFWGQVTGTVKSAQSDGSAFVLAVTKAEFEPATSALKENAPLIGRELTIGVRMPKKPDGVAYPNPEDVAYLKTLKPGMVITAKIFAPRANPKVLRIQAPGKTGE